MTIVEFKDIIKNIDLTTDIKNGNLQKYLLNIFNLTIFDIKYIIFEYKNKSLINGYNDISFFSNFILNDLIKIKIIDIFEEVDIDIDFNKLKEYYNTFLISEDDHFLVSDFERQTNSQTNLQNSFLDLINNIEHQNLENQNLEHQNLEHPNLENQNLEHPNLENPDLENHLINELEINNILNLENNLINNVQIPSLGNPSLGNPSLGNPSLGNPSLGNPSLGNPSLGNPSLGTSSLPRFFFINLIRDLYQTNTTPLQEDVKIVIKEEDFNKIEIINNVNDVNCSICCDEIKDNAIKLKCNHYYHKDCIKKWLCNYSNKCPNCKEEVCKGIPFNI